MAVGEYPRNHGSLTGLSDSDHHIQYAMDSQGLLSARPLPGRPGRLFTDTTSAITYRDTGSSWVPFGTMDNDFDIFLLMGA